MSSSPTNQVFYDNCKTPSPLTPSEVSDLSWPESLQHHVSSWLLSPVRWPFGYLIASPYSPLQVERILPGRNWRDAFEDLLALETRGAMIDPEVRAREIETAEALRASQAAERIRKLNELYWRSVADIDLMEQCLAVAKRRQHQKLIEVNASFIEREHQKIQRRFAFTKNIHSSVNDPPPMTRISSAYCKTYGHWMASIATSGACPGWTSLLTNSADGAWWHFVRRSVATQEAIPGPSLSVTEKELSEFFTDGKFFGVQDPSPSPHDQNTVDAAPQEREDALRIAASVTEDEIGHHFSRWALRPKATILQQTVFSESIDKTQSKAGGFKVVIITQFTDGRKETNEIVDDTSAVLIDVERAVGDISDRNHGLDQESYADGKEEREWRVNMLAMVEATVDDEVDLGIDIEKGAGSV